MNATPSPTQVLIPLLRRVMPSIIASSITGVSPMVGPLGGALGQRPRRRYAVDPRIYRHFLRINNRRRTQGDHDMRDAGYWSVGGVPMLDHADANSWCRSQFGAHAWCRFPLSYRWWFTCQEHAVAFAMVWSDQDASR